MACPAASRSAVPTRSRWGFWLVALVFLLMMMGGTLPVPLYVFWAPSMGFGPLTTTVIFASYSLGVVVALLWLAPLSDRVGRRVMLAVALLFMAISTGFFLAAHGVGALLVARFLCGMATGITTATATAALEELAGPGRQRLAAVSATGANLAGLGLGVVVAGMFAQWGDAPTHLVFWVYLAALVPGLVAVAVTPETVPRRGGPMLVIRRPMVPPAGAGRREFWAVAAGVFAAFAVFGLFSSLVPTFLHTVLQVRNTAVSAAETGLLFFAALIAQLAVPANGLAARLIGPASLGVGIGVFVVGLWTRSMGVFVVGTLLAGAGVGLVLRAGVAATGELAEPDQRADLFATFFLAAYAGTIVPTLGLGLLDQVINQNIATLALAILIGGITVAASVLRPARAAAATS
ncbi:MAG TPA: MFS transporter [Pseudonocardia sp.]|nr:MFS transporter [Pseudonocardia sp.]